MDLKKRTFTDEVLGWYLKNKKKFDFPWRRTKNPYHILVSEIMLQQTQISRVLPKYEEWLKEFPTIGSLTAAPFSRALFVWHGLGYNRRARHLKNCADTIVREYNGMVPKNPELLMRLPGIGHYTSRAVACFAYGKCEPFLDTNIRRVFIYFFYSHLRLQQKIDDKKILFLAARNAPKHTTREWYYALMDYGREVLGSSGNNPNQRSRQYKKQSPFQGSQRQIRAEIVSRLLRCPGGVSERALRNILRQKGVSAIRLLPHNFQSILASLGKENMLCRQGKKWAIARE